MTLPTDPGGLAAALRTTLARLRIAYGEQADQLIEDMTGQTVGGLRQVAAQMAATDSTAGHRPLDLTRAATLDALMQAAGEAPVLLAAADRVRRDVLHRLGGGDGGAAGLQARTLNVAIAMGEVARAADEALADGHVDADEARRGLDAATRMERAAQRLRQAWREAITSPADALRHKLEAAERARIHRARADAATYDGARHDR